MLSVQFQNVRDVHTYFGKTSSTFHDKMTKFQDKKKQTNK